MTVALIISLCCLAVLVLVLGWIVWLYRRNKRNQVQVGIARRLSSLRLSQKKLENELNQKPHVRPVYQFNVVDDDLKKDNEGLLLP